MIRYIKDQWFGYVILRPEALELPKVPVNVWPRYCGPGRGVTELVVPDSIFGADLRMPCFFHDIGFVMADETWEQFHYVNDVFKRNIRYIMDQQRKSKLVTWIQRYIAHRYVDAVETIGESIFMSLDRSPLRRRKQLFDIISPVYLTNTNQIIDRLCSEK